MGRRIAPLCARRVLPSPGHTDSIATGMAGNGEAEPGFRAKLAEQFEARRERNPRYSLRAFAAFLGADHSTLSQILRGARRTPAGQLRSWGKKLGLGAEETAAYIAAERLPELSASEREVQVRH